MDPMRTVWAPVEMFASVKMDIGAEILTVLGDVSLIKQSMGPWLYGGRLFIWQSLVSRIYGSFSSLLERLRNHTCTATCTCSEVLNPVSVILK